MNIRRRASTSRYEEYRDKAAKQYGYVYLLHCSLTGFYKVGWTLRSPLKRLEEIRAEFRVGFDWQLEGYIHTLNPPGVEALLHRWLAPSRVTDKREWFVLTGDLVKVVALIFESSMDDPTAELASARQNAYSEGYRDGIQAGRHLQELDDTDEVTLEDFSIYRSPH